MKTKKDIILCYRFQTVLNKCFKVLKRCVRVFHVSDIFVELDRTFHGFDRCILGDVQTDTVTSQVHMTPGIDFLLKFSS